MKQTKFSLKKLNLFGILPFVVLVGLLVAGLSWWQGQTAFANTALEVTLAIGTLPLVIRIISSLLKGHLGIDAIAILAIAGAWLLNQYLAGAIIVLMLSGGEALEEYAKGRARKELDQLLVRAPHTAHQKTKSGILDVKVEAIRPDDVVVVKPGEIVPVDGVVMAGSSDIDESAITGEPLPVSKEIHSHVMSGTINQNGVFEVRAIHSSVDSKYEQIIRLVREAEKNRAPIVRLADRYSVWFTVVTVVLAGLAWFISADPIRALAVLVVATPCPLILAAPIAIVSGMSKAAARGIIIKNGSALEKLGEASAFVFDKTGTLTVGSPEVTEVLGYGINSQEALRLAASLDQLSTHILARSLVSFARRRVKQIEYPENFKEFFGDGVAANLNGKEYILGKLNFLLTRGVRVPQAILARRKKLQEQGIMVVYLASGKTLLGEIHFADVARKDSQKLFRGLLLGGIKKIMMLTGDHKAVAAQVAAAIGIPEFKAELLPEQKVAEVRKLQKEYSPLVMVGDGINDAPALASADVGIALGAYGTTASSEAGDIVVMVDSLDRIKEAWDISSFALRIAKQSIFVGIGLSLVLMVIAVFGFIKPVFGALLQEVIDVLVIVNALRVNYFVAKR